jgi:alkylation response protein AidB-like acyl-CoA dehydrogenase
MSVLSPELRSTNVGPTELGLGAAARSGATLEQMVSHLTAAVKQELVPQVAAIDAGYYPAEFMHGAGRVGAFSQAVAPEYGGMGNGLLGALRAIEIISQECLCTGFMAWCQVACTWYMQNSDNLYLKDMLLPSIASGETLGGTGLSNPMKHFAGIEKIALEAQRQPGGYVLNGMLPWVSNVGAGHHFGIAAQIQGSDEYLMAIVSDALSGLTLRGNAHFIALEGSNTFSCVFRDVFVPDVLILAAPSDAYVNRIRPGFMLTQAGMGLGLVAGCLDMMARSNQRYGHVNCFLDDPVETLQAELDQARLTAYGLADALTQLDGPIAPARMREVIQLRLLASELSLRASQSAMLHCGARGYLQGAAAARKLRESYFVAIVTPATKQLKKMLHHLDCAG